MPLSRRNALISISSVLAAPALLKLTNSQASEKVTWRMQALWGGGTTPQKFEEIFVSRVAELTGGGFEIKLFSEGQIVANAQAFDAVRGGAFEMMKTFDGYAAGKIPTFGFTSTVPFGFPESEQYEAWFYEKDGLDIAKQAYAPAGLTYIAPTIYGEEPIHSKFPIKTLSDLKGKKGRFVGLASTVMAEFGVAVSPLPTSEVYSALDKGLIDFADRGDLQANYEIGLHEVAKYIVLPGVHQPTTATSYVAHTKSYEALPDDYKLALDTAAKEISLSLRQHLVESSAEYLQKFIDSGVEVNYLDTQEITNARKKAVDAWKIATKDDSLALKAMNSQIALMKEFELLS